MSPRNSRFTDTDAVLIKAGDPMASWTFRDEVAFALKYEPLASLGADERQEFEAAAAKATRPSELPPLMWYRFNQAYSTGLRETRG